MKTQRRTSSARLGSVSSRLLIPSWPTCFRSEAHINPQKHEHNMFVFVDDERSVSVWVWTLIGSNHLSVPREDPSHQLTLREESENRRVVFMCCWVCSGRVGCWSSWLRRSSEGTTSTWCYSRFWSGHVIWTVKVLTRSLCWGARCCCVSVQTPSQCHSFVGCWVRGNFINCV